MTAVSGADRDGDPRSSLKGRAFGVGRCRSQGKWSGGWDKADRRDRARNARLGDQMAFTSKLF